MVMHVNGDKALWVKCTRSCSLTACIAIAEAISEKKMEKRVRGRAACFTTPGIVLSVAEFCFPFFFLHLRGQVHFCSSRKVFICAQMNKLCLQVQGRHNLYVALAPCDGDRVRLLTSNETYT